MKFLLFLGLALTSINVYADTPYRFVNKNIEFAKGKSGNDIFWTQEQCLAYETKYPTATILTIVPQSFEIAISTILLPSNKNEFEIYKTKAGFFEKILEFQTALNLAETLQDNSKVSYYTNLLIYLKSVYENLN